MRVNVVASRDSGKLQGVSELKKALAILGEEVATKEGRRANRLAANGMARVMKTTAPRSRDGDRSPGSTKFGRLVDNIRVRLAKARNENTITYNISVGRAFWGFFLEFGTAKMPARPWMRTAFDSSVRNAQTAQIDELKKGVERAAKKAFKRSGAG